MGSLVAKDPAYWNSNIAPEPEHNNRKWMADIPSTTEISELSIPGTHASMSFHTKGKGNVWVYCQCVPLPNQLNLGIRFLDIGCQHVNNTLRCHHNKSDHDRTILDVLNTTVSFLDSNPSEAVLIRIYEAAEPNDNYQSFSQSLKLTLDLIPSHRIWKKSSTCIPSLGEARGKIILIIEGDFENPSLDCNVCTFHDVRDSINIDDKCFIFFRNLDGVRGVMEKGMIRVGYSSCAGKTPAYGTAREINPRLHHYVIKNPGRLGIVVMDYPGPMLINDIIHHNIYKYPDLWGNIANNNHTWMDKILPSKKISELSIPGTHSTMSYHIQHQGSCQCWPLKLQLKLGIRFIDVGCQHSNNTLCYHDCNVNIDITLTDVFDDIVSFLNSYRSETILVHIYEAGTPRNNDQSFAKTLKSYLDRLPSDVILKSSNVPTMENARGRIILVIANDTLNPSLDCIRHDINSTAGDENNCVHIDKISIIFSSCIMGVQPIENARKNNPNLHSFVHKTNKFGVVVMDYPDLEIISDIIIRNMSITTT